MEKEMGREGSGDGEGGEREREREREFVFDRIYFYLEDDAEPSNESDTREFIVKVRKGDERGMGGLEREREKEREREREREINLHNAELQSKTKTPNLSKQEAKLNKAHTKIRK